MELYDRNVINMDTKLSEMLPYLKGSNKEDITLKRMLSHYAFSSLDSFYTKTLDSVTEALYSLLFFQKEVNFPFRWLKIFTCAKGLCR